MSKFRLNGFFFVWKPQLSKPDFLFLTTYPFAAHIFTAFHWFVSRLTVNIWLFSTPSPAKIHPNSCSCPQLVIEHQSVTTPHAVFSYFRTYHFITIISLVYRLVHTLFWFIAYVKKATAKVFQSVFECHRKKWSKLNRFERQKTQWLIDWLN